MGGGEEGGILIRKGGSYWKEGAFTCIYGKFNSRCWLSLLFRVRPEAGKKKIDFQNVFFFLAVQV